MDRSRMPAVPASRRVLRNVQGAAGPAARGAASSVYPRRAQPYRMRRQDKLPRQHRLATEADPRLPRESFAEQLMRFAREETARGTGPRL